MRSTADLTGVIRHLRAPTGDGPGDPELLDRYTHGHDQAAFATLVRRYGPLVLGVARRQLADVHRAEDVFQATFLALARSAARLGGRPVLANWLYVVALRQARKARAQVARCEALELAAPPRPSSGGDPLAEITARELVQAIDDELTRLPDRLRLPVLLCCVQGLSREEACRRLGCSDGALRGLLDRGRRRLAARLAARGLAPSAVLLAPLAAAGVPADLLARTAEQSASPWSNTVPAAVADLTATAARRTLLPTVAVVGCVLAAALAGWVVASGGADPVQPPAATPPAASAPGPAANAAPDDPLPEGATLRFGSPRYHHPTWIENLAVSADGTFAVASSRAPFLVALRTYDLATGRVLRTFHDNDKNGDNVGAVALSPDAKTLAWTCNAPKCFALVLHDAATGKETARIPLSTRTRQLLFTPDGKRVVVGADDESSLDFTLMGLPKGEVIRTIPNAARVFTAALSPDGKHLLAAGYDSQKSEHFARRWELDTGRELDPLPVGKEGIGRAAYSPDGATVAVGADSGWTVGLRLIDAATAKERLSIPFPDLSGFKSFAFSPDGKTLAAAAGSSTRLFDTATGKERVRIDRGAIGLRFSPDGATLVGAVAGAIYRWDAATGKSLIPEGGDSPVDQIAVTADGKRVVSRGGNGDAHIWDAKTGEHLWRVSVRFQHQFALSPDGPFLVWPEMDPAIEFPSTGFVGTTRIGSRLRLMDVTTGKIDERFGGFEGDAYDLFFTPDGKTLVTADRHGRQAAVRVWDVASGKVVRSFPAEWKPDWWVMRSGLSPDGEVLAVLYQEVPRGLEVRNGIIKSEVKLWDVATGKEVAGLTPPWFEPEVMAVAPDGKTLAVLTSGTMQFRDTASGEVRGTFRGPADLTALAFGPDGRVFTGNPDGTVLAWDPRVVKLPPADRK
jgi:RNA polymerase sigma factor (sigma-70 family)